MESNNRPQQPFKNKPGEGGIVIRKITPKPSPQQQQQPILQSETQLQNSKQTQQFMQQSQSFNSNSQNQMQMMSGGSLNRSENILQEGSNEGQSSKKRKFPYPETQEQLEKIQEQKQINAKRLKQNDQLINKSDQISVYSGKNSHNLNENSLNTMNLKHQSHNLLAQRKLSNHSSSNSNVSFKHIPIMSVMNSSTPPNQGSHGRKLSSNMLSSSDSIDFDKLEEFIDLTDSQLILNNQDGVDDQNKQVQSRNMSIGSNVLRQIEEDIENEEKEEEEHKQLQIKNNHQSQQNSHQQQQQIIQIEDSSQSNKYDSSSILTISADQFTAIQDKNQIKQGNKFETQQQVHSDQPQVKKVLPEFFLNRCFYITKLTQINPFSLKLELDLAPPLDQNGVPIRKEVSVKCNIEFRLNIIGNWARKLFAEVGDMVRVIGNFCLENKFQLILDDNEQELTINKASMIIVEPYIMIPCTSIVKAFPCARNALLSHQFKGLNTDINYALVLGNTIHGVFQSILQNMDFKKESLQKMVKEAIQDQLLYLFFLKKTEQEVQIDVERGVQNITKWLNMMFRGDFNQYGIKYRKFLAAEQEFNTHTYGIKGNIDSTIQIEDSEGNIKSTALEIKTGKNKSNAYRGQVLLYSLIISERFKNANPENILLYIMDQNVADGFQYIRQSKIELDNIIMGRNELAKWQKSNNSTNIQLPTTLKSQQEYEDLNKDEKAVFDYSIKNLNLIKYPQMIKQTSECKYCYARNVCTITALTLEPEDYRKSPAGQFPTFQDMEKTLETKVKLYYKKFVECIQLEQNAETDRNSNQANKQSFQRETNLKIVKVVSNQKGGSLITLEKEFIEPALESEKDTSQILSESTFVNLYTKGNITFSKGYLISREIDFKPKTFTGDSPLKSQNNLDNPIQIEDSQVLLEDIENKMQDIDKYFCQVVIYTIEFAHLMPQNLSKDALGGKDPLSQNQEEQVIWTIESEPFSNFSYSMMRSNILALCTDNRFDKLKDLLVLKKQTYEIPEKHINMVTQKFKDKMMNLNDDQKTAISKSILCQDFQMIYGVPGSGKTQTIVTLINILASIKKKILLVNFSNQQVDSLLVSLKESGFENFTRISSNASSVDQRIRDKVITSSTFTSMQQITDFLDQTFVFGMTCLSMNNPILLAVKKFDYCIFDDAEQISEPLALGPIIISEKFIMAGDFKQRSIQVKSFIAERKGLGKSLFERLCEEQKSNLTKFKVQYRVNKDVMEVANKLNYNDEMICNLDNIALQRVVYQPSILQAQRDQNRHWLDKTRTNQVLIINPDNIISKIPLSHRQSTIKSKNFIEASIIEIILKDLQENAVSMPDEGNSLKVAVVAAGQDHSSYLNKQLKAKPQNQQKSIINNDNLHEQQQLPLDQQIGADQIQQQQSKLQIDLQITSVDRVGNQLDCDILIFSCGLWSQGADKNLIQQTNSKTAEELKTTEEIKEDQVKSQQQVKEEKYQPIKDFKKLNYVLSRPKKKLIVIGSKENLKQQKQLYKLFLACKMKGWYTELEENDFYIMMNLSDENRQYFNNEQISIGDIPNQ